MQLAPKLRDEIAKKMSALPEIRRVILFGSRARGDAWSRSDIDLAIDAPADSISLWERVMEIRDSLETLLPVDIIFLEQAPPGLAERIRAEGVAIYERNADPAKAQ
ncbi:MAG TPA: nucleotidyltransferase domain-containing protein [Firmicutes bacterium]|nr:nucleotidyltransferase domain-containing protein [Bacillota bacterium]HHY98015.1 nucleotidyltransferase domain-containing protein [Bacillota bacterium]